MQVELQSKTNRDIAKPSTSKQRRAIDAQSLCEKLLRIDSRIVYSSCLATNGHRAGEAITDLIGEHDELTIIVLPLNHAGDSLVLAVPIGSDLTEIVTKALQYEVKVEESTHSLTPY